MIKFSNQVVAALQQCMGLTEEQIQQYTHFNMHRHELQKFIELLTIEKNTGPIDNGRRIQIQTEAKK